MIQSYRIPMTRAVARAASAKSAGRMGRFDIAASLDEGDDVEIRGWAGDQTKQKQTAASDGDDLQGHAAICQGFPRTARLCSKSHWFSTMWILHPRIADVTSTAWGRSCYVERTNWCGPGVP